MSENKPSTEKKQDIILKVDKGVFTLQFEMDGKPEALLYGLIKQAEYLLRDVVFRSKMENQKQTLAQKLKI